MLKRLSIALIQLKVNNAKSVNIERAAEKIKLASEQKAQLVALPECFNSPYGTQHFNENAEAVPDGPTCQMLSRAAKENRVYVVGGTIPERQDDKLYNTCTVWDPNGRLIAKFRKMHLFDIDIPGKITFKESDVLSPGEGLSFFSIEDRRFGLTICYDLRFPELSMVYRRLGCDAIICPGSFNMTTGPLHWELLQRARAVDNQMYVVSISPAQGTEGYISWGHTMVSDPWGEVKGLEFEEDTLFYELDFSKCSEMRTNIPISHQRRDDIYELVYKKSCQ